jgi:hypothetical protein
VRPTSIYISSTIKLRPAELADKQPVIDPYLTNENFEPPHEERKVVSPAAGFGGAI